VDSDFYFEASEPLRDQFIKPEIGSRPIGFQKPERASNDERHERRQQTNATHQRRG